MRRFEIVLYFVVYIAYLLHGLVSLFMVRDQILEKADFEFDAGWSWIGRPRDNSNDDFENFTHFMMKMWPWYIFHMLVSAAVDKMCPHRRSSGHTFVGVVAIICTQRFESVTALGTLLLSFYVASCRKSKKLTWLLACFWVIVVNVIKDSSYFHGTLEYTDRFMLIITLAWSLMRCCSFSLSRIRAAQNDSTHTFEHFLGYALYFPSLVYGPFMEFRRYAVITKIERQTKSLHTRYIILCCELARVLFWWIFMQVLLHVFYIHYLAHDVRALQLVGNSFGQYNVVYYMGQFFFIYYVITYGLGIAFARFDYLEPPNRPRCIGRIHFYSDMWKHFDEGMYEFLFNNIYCELCGRHSRVSTKLFATAVTFGFVFVWHGCYEYIFIWSALNFGCLVAEKFFKAIVYAPAFTKRTTELFGRNNAQRLSALLGTQLFIPAAFANLYFISGHEVGNYLMRGTYLSGWANYLALTWGSYCFFQCSALLDTNKHKLKM